MHGIINMGFGVRTNMPFLCEFSLRDDCSGRSTCLQPSFELCTGYNWTIQKPFSW
eukprot:m.713444 g.713444  ORF g.713444 m.713444 type:complete len:55 (+) comp22971_c1_seq19:722-886(+)